MVIGMYGGRQLGMYKLHKGGFPTNYHLGASYRSTNTENCTTHLAVAIKMRQRGLTLKAKAVEDRSAKNAKKYTKRRQRDVQRPLLCKLCMPSWRPKMAPPKHRAL